MKKNTILKCESCGLMAETISGCGCTSCSTCCGEPMTEIEPKTADTKVEKHVPFPEETTFGMKISVGENVKHPMTDVHYVEWIEVIDGDAVYRIHLKPGMDPAAQFPVKMRKGMLLREYCNLHGLWQKEI